MTLKRSLRGLPRRRDTSGGVATRETPGGNATLAVAERELKTSIQGAPWSICDVR